MTLYRLRNWSLESLIDLPHIKRLVTCTTGVSTQQFDYRTNVSSFLLITCSIHSEKIRRFENFSEKTDQWWKGTLLLLEAEVRFLRKERQKLGHNSLVSCLFKTTLFLHLGTELPGFLSIWITRNDSIFSFLGVVLTYQSIFFNIINFDNVC
jgi:hypothetical protein